MAAEAFFPLQAQEARSAYGTGILYRANETAQTDRNSQTGFAALNCLDLSPLPFAFAPYLAAPYEILGFHRDFAATQALTFGTVWRSFA